MNFYSSPPSTVKGLDPNWMVALLLEAHIGRLRVHLSGRKREEWAPCVLVEHLSAEGCLLIESVVELDRRLKEGEVVTFTYTAGFKGRPLARWFMISDCDLREGDTLTVVLPIRVEDEENCE